MEHVVNKYLFKKKNARTHAHAHTLITRYI